MASSLTERQAERRGSDAKAFCCITGTQLIGHRASLLALADEAGRRPQELSRVAPQSSLSGAAHGLLSSTAKETFGVKSEVGS